jgi:hypothetical protein
MTGPATGGARRAINRWRHAGVALCFGATFAACGSGKQPADSANQHPDATATNRTGTQPSKRAWEPAIPIASMPSDPCAWIPAADVEAIIGKLAEAPTKKDDGCRYILVMPEAVAAKRQQANAMREKMREKFRQAFGTSAAESEQPNPVLDRESDPRTYAVIVNVDVSGQGAANPKKADGTVALDDWDEVRPGAYRFTGRTGHVRITVAGQAPDVPRESIPVLAARVRDRIPDLPFAVTNPYQVLQSNEGDPCSLLTRAEAEAVLGPLLIEPYRASSESPPFAHGEGHACAYYTPGHRVFVLSPTWTGGAQSFDIEKGIGGIIGIVAPQENVVIKGPWEQTHMKMSGSLLFLKGDRLLEVHYLTSKASLGDALKLAATAMRRLSP